jgi:hypothetical protein
VENDDFSADIMLKSYPKYKYQSVSIGLKTAKNEAFLKVFNRSNSEHLLIQNPLNKRGYCIFCSKRDGFESEKILKSEDSFFQKDFQLNTQNLIEISSEKKNPLRFRGKRVKWWCKECEKFVCKEYWNLFH